MVKPTGGGRRHAARKGGPGGAGGKRIFYILLALLLIAGIATLSYMSARSNQSVTQIDASVAPIPNQGHVIGSESALVEVVEFADFECPACGNFATLTEPDVRARLVNTGQIRFRFMDYPITSLHPNTIPAHSAAWCASEQGKFWEMHDILFQNQDRWSAQATRRPEGVLTGLARQVGLKIDQFETCFRSRKYHAQIQANLEEGVRRRVQSTPTFIIGSKLIAGNTPYDEFKKHVDEAIARASASTKQTKTDTSRATGTKGGR